MALLETYKPMREYIIKYLDLKINFYCNVFIFNRLNRIEIHISPYAEDMPFKHFIGRLNELKINFLIETNFDEDYIILTEDEYLKLYTLCSLKNEF